jgi:hypothetical protein
MARRATKPKPQERDTVVVDRKQIPMFNLSALPEAKLVPYVVPPRGPVTIAEYERWPIGKQLTVNDGVTLINTDNGAAKQVRFCDLMGPRAYVQWPIANEVLAVSLKTGHVVVPRSLGHWQLEPNALASARTMRLRTAADEQTAVLDEGDE